MPHAPASGRANLSIWALTAVLVPSGPALAQEARRDPYFITTAAKTTSHMPRVIIRNIRQDHAGNVWFATFGGPIRYDGNEFTNFGDEVDLAGMRVFAVHVDRSGALWFGSVLAGVSRYDGKSVTRFTSNAPAQPAIGPQPGRFGGLAADCIHAIFEDREGNFWFGTTNGVSRFDGKSITNFSKVDGLLDNSVYAIAQDASGRMWFGTQSGVCSWDGESFSDLAEQVGRSFQNIRVVCVAPSGDLWFGGQDGAFRYDGEKLTAFTAKEGLLADFVGSMLIDRKGNIWFGHPGGFPDFRGGGTTRFDGESFEQLTREDGLRLDTVFAIAEDKDGNIWFGSAGDGAFRYDGKTFTDLSPPATRK